MKVLFVLGTRPEIIKCFPVYKELKNRGYHPKILFTNQHFSKEMQVWDDFKYNKEDILIGFNAPDIVLVQGDTWSVMLGVLESLKRGIKIGHIEAGIRSFDPKMPEERIRSLVDEFADICFAPTQLAVKNISDKNVYLTGNTIADVLAGHRKDKPKYILLTLHRPETVDNTQQLDEILQAVEMISTATGYKVYFPVHPRTKPQIRKKYNITLLDPQSYWEFIWYLKKSALVLTDSGGVQEEAAILHIPCATIRTSTERQETIEAGLNVLTGYVKEDIFYKSLNILSNYPKKIPNLYGENVSKKIVDILEKI